MDDNISKEDQPSASKKDVQKAGPNDDAEHARDDSQDSRLDSESTASSYVSVNSRVDTANARHKPLKPQLEKGPKPERKKRGRPPGRIEKRAAVRRPIPRKAPKRRVKHRQERKKRDLSVSTIFTRLSSGSPSPSIGCIYCGHRCCRRRFEYQAWIKRRRSPVRRKIRRRRPKLKIVVSKQRGSECVQAGSRCLMLSTLCLGTNATPPEKTDEQPIQYCGVTPEMIYETVRRLTMWRQEVSAIAILDYMKRNFPVCQDIPQLFEEIYEKLHIAALAGIVTHTRSDGWCLNCALQKRKLTKTHVTMFWNLYADTLKPVTKKANMIPSKEVVERQTNTGKVNVIMESDPNDII